MTKRILHITVGDTGWNPTKAQIDEIGNLFRDAVHKQEDSIIVTSHQVVAKVLDVQELEGIQVVSAHVDTIPTENIKHKE